MERNRSLLVAVQDWELESLVTFLDLLYSSKTSLSETNKMLWSLARNHRYEVKSFYNTLQSGESSFFPWKRVWKVKAPSRIAFFTWTVALGKILTIDNVRRQGLTLVN
jgi:hypothetical protein